MVDEQKMEVEKKVEETPTTPAVGETKEEHINIRVVGQHGGEVYFKIKQLMPLKKLMSAYCDRQGQALQAIRFVYDGNRISETDTPKSLGMEDNDVIDAMLAQTGGK